MILQAPQAYESRSNQMAMASIPNRIVIYLEIIWLGHKEKQKRYMLFYMFPR